MKKGFTLIELTIVIALMAILFTIYFLVGNPGGQLAQSRNTKRLLDLQTIMNGVRQNVADQANGQFLCSSGSVPTSTARMTSDPGPGNYDIAPCLITTYLFALPFDLSATSSRWVAVNDYDTGYTISINASGTITLSAPYAELGKSISVSR